MNTLGRVKRESAASSTEATAKQRTAALGSHGRLQQAGAAPANQC